ncbi:hypothetical protein SAMN04487977_101496 [Treponema bryantii]|uniref:DUF7192 domain-containing protein n=1 Tax=Treponema bryantii TaxID=163 RepID=A0A1H9AYN1_9SPIR|nr:hypothetical protein [Treponema bryantii]SEP81098.1 hypothetical protein SAMN04487977_101496 [Treponema bryantii]
MDLQFEKFKSIYEFDNIINSRKTNEVMRYNHSSQQISSWSGTKTFEIAEDLLAKGWSAKVDDMKTELQKYSKQVERICVKHKPNMAGFAPIVPAAIKGVPKAMWANTPRKKIEKKFMHIYFNNTGNCNQTSEELMKSGMAVLKLCILLEKIGIRVKIDIMPIVSHCNNSVYGCGIEIKDYQQPFNLQKMAYPIAHTAMFRRQGFKWLETFPKCTEKRFSKGYGYALQAGAMENAFRDKFKMNEKGSVYITYYDCKRCGFDAEKLALEKGILLEKKGGK